jgi:hypothetical protein
LASTSPFAATDDELPAFPSAQRWQHSWGGGGGGGGHPELQQRATAPPGGSSPGSPPPSQLLPAGSDYSSGLLPRAAGAGAVVAPPPLGVLLGASPPRQMRPVSPPAAAAEAEAHLPPSFFGCGGGHHRADHQLLEAADLAAGYASPAAGRQHQAAACAAASPRPSPSPSPQQQQQLAQDPLLAAAQAIQLATPRLFQQHQHLPGPLPPPAARSSEAEALASDPVLAEALRLLQAGVPPADLQAAGVDLDRLLLLYQHQLQLQQLQQAAEAEAAAAAAVQQQQQQQQQPALLAPASPRGAPLSVYEDMLATALAARLNQMDEVTRCVRGRRGPECAAAWGMGWASAGCCHALEPPCRPACSGSHFGARTHARTHARPPERAAPGDHARPVGPACRRRAILRLNEALLSQQRGAPGAAASPSATGLGLGLAYSSPSCSSPARPGNTLYKVRVGGTVVYHHHHPGHRSSPRPPPRLPLRRSCAARGRRPAPAATAPSASSRTGARSCAPCSGTPSTRPRCVGGWRQRAAAGG